MHRINNLFRGGRGRPTFSGNYGYQGNAADGAELSSYSFPTIPIGPADPNKLVIVGINYTDASGNPDINSVTIDGVTATKHVNKRPNSSGGFYLGAAIYSAIVSTGGNVTVDVNLNQLITNCAITVWSVIGLDSVTPVDTGSSQSSGASSRNATIATQPDGILVAVSSLNITGKDCSWTNADEDHDSDDDDSWSGASLQKTNGGDINVNALWTASSEIALAVASWR